MFARHHAGFSGGPGIETPGRSGNPSVLWCWVVLGLLSATGCASPCPIHGGRVAYTRCQPIVAETSFSSRVESSDSVSPSRLDAAWLDLVTGRSDATLATLRAYRDDWSPPASLSVGVDDLVSMLSDDRVRTYDPPAYERAMVRTILSLADLSTGGGDAHAYTLQAVEDESPTAISQYLRGVVRESTLRNYDDAARRYRLVAAVRPDCGPIDAAVRRADGGSHSRPGHGVVHVVAMVGRGPLLAETTAPVTTEVLTAASIIWSQVQNGDDEDAIVLPNIASVCIPEVVIPESRVLAVGIRTDAGPAPMVTETVTDLASAAIADHHRRERAILIRAVLRRAAKEVAVAKVSDSLGLEGNRASIFRFVASTGWSAAERADTRCWRTLPREIQVARLELPAGLHRITFEPIDAGGGVIGPGETREVEVTDGRDHFELVFAPETLVPRRGATSEGI